MNRNKRVLSVLTGLLLLGASNKYTIKHTQTIKVNPIIVEIDGQQHYMASRGILTFDGDKLIEMITRVTKETKDALISERYLLEDNSYNYTLTETPKIKRKK